MVVNTVDLLFASYHPLLDEKMSNSNEDEVQPPQKPPSPPPHTTFAARGIHVRALRYVRQMQGRL